MTAISFWRRWALAAAAVALTLWFVIPVNLGQPLVGLKSHDEWTTPSVPRSQLTPAAAVLVAGAGFWGVQATAAQAAAAPVDTRWRLSGVLGAEGDRRVLISFADASKPSELLARGDKLPSGHRITKIGEHDVCVELGKRSYTLALERLDLKE